MAELVLWDEKYETGIDQIDGQHVRLVSMINNLIKAKDADSEAIKLVTQITLEQLVDYTHFHFQYEEAQLEKAKYKDVENHKKIHRIFEKRIVEIERKFSQENKVISDELVGMLKEWLIDHIGKVDMEYAKDLKK